MAHCIHDGHWDGCGAGASAKIEEVGQIGRYKTAGAEVCDLGMALICIVLIKLFGML